MSNGLPNVTVEAAFGFSMFDASPTWTDISAYVRRLTVRRGRNSITGRFNTGVATLTLDDRDGRFNPDNTAGAYYSDVKIGVPIRIQHTISSTYPVFYGSARAWTPEYPKSQDAFVKVPLADGFYSINLEDLAGNSYSAEATDSRITNVLDDIGWPAALRDLDSGVARVQATDFAQPQTGGEQPALRHLLDVAEAEAGTLFVARDGDVTFKNRVAYSSASSATTFDDTEMHALKVAYDDDYLFNDVRVSREDGAQVTVTDTTSISDHGRRVLTRDVMPMETDAEALNVAEWLSAIFGEQRLRVEALTLKPLPGNESLLADILDRELRDVVTVNHVPPGGDTINQACAIEEIRHDLTPGQWTTTFEVQPLSSTESADYWVLGTSALDTTTRLA